MAAMNAPKYAAPISQMIVCTLVVFGQNAPKHSDRAVPGALQGTINAILANGSGLVAVTDSLLSPKPPLGPQLQGRKLFKLDDRTICTVAGFYRQSGPNFGPFGSAARAALNQVESAYVEQRVSNLSFRSVQQKLESFARLVAFSFGVASTTAFVSGIPVPKEHITVSVAGFDADGSLKVGQVDLIPRLLKTRIEYVPSNPTLLTVDKALAPPVLAGMPDCAHDVLDHPEKYSVKYPAVARYAKSMAADNGQSLTLLELLNLGESLEAQSHECYPDQVGGKVETVMLQKGLISSLDNEIPPEVDIDRVREPKAPLFSVLIDTVSKNKLPQPTVAFDVHPNVAVVVIGGTFENNIVRFDNAIITGASFDNCTFSYGGSPLTVFDQTNTVKNSTLHLDSGVDPASPFVVSLKKAFPGLRVAGPQ